MLWLFLLSGCLFVTVSTNFIVTFSGDLSDLGFLYLLLSEVLFVISSLLLKDYRDKRLVYVFNKRYGWSCQTVDEVKKERLKRLLNAPSSEFSDKAVQFDKAFELYYKYRPALDFSVKSFSRWVYSPDARPRILTLLLFLGSAVLLLTARENISLTSLFDFYHSAEWSEIFTVYLIVFFIIAFGLMSLSIIFRVLIQLLYLWSWRTSGSSYINENISGYIVRALLELHEPPVSRQQTVLTKLRRRGSKNG